MSISFATTESKCFESDCPDKCPICGFPVQKLLYSAECSNNWKVCQWSVEFIEAEDSELTIYDYEMGIIISD